MSIPASCILWHKLESAGVSEKGPDPVEYNPPTTYASAKFGLGVDCGTGNSVARPYLVFPSAWYLDQSTVEFWVKPTYGSGSIGVTHNLMYQVYTSGNEIRIATDGFWVIISGYAYYIFQIDETWSSGDLIHIAVTLDVSAGATAKIKFYCNGVSQTFSSIYSGYDNVWPVGYDDIEVGGYYSPDCIIDNIKVFDYIKTDFSDRFVEGFGGGATSAPIMWYWN